MESQPIGPLTGQTSILTIEDAYQISILNHKRKLTDPKIKAIGKKIGLTAVAVQKQFGVHEPDFGYLTSDMNVVNTNGNIHILPKGSLIQGKVEGEVAFVLKQDLLKDNVQAEDVIAATDYAVACIEIIDSRVADWKIKIQDTIADNASAAFLVLGKEKKKLSEIDLRMAGMALRLNHEVESTGIGAACLGHPVNAMVWLANRMLKLGDPLKKGDVILSGAYGPVVPFKPGDLCEVEINGLGKVSCKYEL
jgi:2-oxopent-4-enoate hydratase